MRILKAVRREDSGLFRTTMEHAKYEERLGHEVCLKEPNGPVLYGFDGGDPDVVTVHSQMDLAAYHDGTPKIMLMHGEPLSSVGNGVSFKAIIDLAPLVDCFIAMRRSEVSTWNLLKRTYFVPKGVDLEMFRPLQAVEKLPGEPAILVYENQRGARNPLYITVAMEQVYRALPKARLHIVNFTDKKMYETFSSFVSYAKLWRYVRTLGASVPFEDVPRLLNSADIVVSALHPLSARGIEALACGKAYVSAGYDEPGYPWRVPEYSPEAFAETILACWADYEKVNYRQWAEACHDEAEASRQRCEIYARYA